MISLARSDGHYDGVSKVLELLRDEISSKLAEARNILVKPNFVSVRHPLSATHVDAVKAVLDFIYSHNSKARVIIGEGPAMGSFSDGLRNYGYLDLKRKYNVEFIDLNHSDYVYFDVYDSKLSKSIRVRVSKVVLDSDFRISVCRPKTHDTVVVTLTIKNLVMGAVQGRDKPKVHAGYGAINMSIAELYTKMPLSLAVIDGYVGMQGDGPVGGREIDSRFAVAGVNAVEVDALTAWLMGFSPLDVGYLYLLWKWGYGEINVDRMRIVGGKPEDLRRIFEPHRNFIRQLSWKKDLNV